jgi:X-linked retinitis pigmentosa GTPase regulator
VYSCGEAKQGQLGLGPISLDRVNLPTNIKQLNDQQIHKIACGKFHSLFINGSSSLLTCGANNFGQLGTGCKSNYFTPTLIESISDVREVSAWNYSAAITNRNELFAWGTGIFGEYLRPRHILEFDGQFRQVLVGGAFSILLDFENKAYSWGSISDGFSTGPSTTPSLIQTIDGKAVISGAVGDSYAFLLGQTLMQGEDSSSRLVDDYAAELSIGGAHKSIYDCDSRYGQHGYKHQSMDQTSRGGLGFSQHQSLPKSALYSSRHPGASSSQYDKQI